jgi:hypothetical protein
MEFLVNKNDIESALQISILSTESSENITGQALFEIDRHKIKIIATDQKTKLSRTESPINLFSGDPISFTSDPRKILSLLKTGDKDLIKFNYNDTTKTLKLFLSENSESYVSLPSMDISTYAIDNSLFDKSFDLEPINSGIIITGIQFIKDFLDQKNLKFSNLFISQGIMYGSNGVNKVAAFTSPVLAGLDEIILPLSILSPVINFLDITNTKNIIIGTTSHHIFIKDGNNNSFGFSKVQVPIPKMPITIEEPNFPGWSLNRKDLLKKLARLRLSKDAHIGIKGTFSENQLQLETVSDRDSKDFVPCVSYKGDVTQEAGFFTECKIFENAIDQFKNDTIKIFINKRIFIHDNANIETIEKDGSTIRVPFSNSAVIAFSRQS